VIVKNGRVLSKGFHHAVGQPHAEIEALEKLTNFRNLRDAGFDPDSLSPVNHSLKGATIYVTLEPCSSHGKTPPCTEALIRAGIDRVVYGSTDPDKRHRGRATRRAAGWGPRTTLRRPRRYQRRRSGHRRQWRDG
jgi:diaminohydroxyphosphoribosylaminopyrimidine deaminase/5-amino-6-(5-phosphoribosylamino)uracil reductase